MQAGFDGVLTAGPVIVALRSDLFLFACVAPTQSGRNHQVRRLRQHTRIILGNYLESILRIIRILDYSTSVGNPLGMK